MSVLRRPDLTGLPSAEEASRQAYEMAGVTAKDVKVADVHDCFTIAEIMVTEALGFFEPGGGGGFLEAEVADEVDPVERGLALVPHDPLFQVLDVLLELGDLIVGLGFLGDRDTAAEQGDDRPDRRERLRTQFHGLRDSLRPPARVPERGYDFTMNLIGP